MVGRKSIWVLVAATLVAFITINSLTQTYELREKILNKIDGYFNNDFSAPNHPGHAFWAKEILNGGYILHFRHAEREKWIDVQMYDALESDLHTNGENQSREAEFDYFKKAVCLNYRGDIQARAMAEVVKHSKLPYQVVVASPSCRARQTAELVFGKYDRLERILVHKGPYAETEASRIDALKKLYRSIKPSVGTNTIVSAHNSVVNKEMFDNFHSLSDLYLEEGGFYVISEKSGVLKLEHEFHYFRDFSKQFFRR